MERSACEGHIENNKLWNIREAAKLYRRHLKEHDKESKNLGETVLEIRDLSEGQDMKSEVVKRLEGEDGS